jgi:hypothetical protein
MHVKNSIYGTLEFYILILSPTTTKKKTQEKTLSLSLSLAVTNKPKKTKYSLLPREGIRSRINGRDS